MKRIMVLLVISLGFCLNENYAQEVKKVAVFDPAGELDESLKSIVREEISNVFVAQDGYAVLERSLIKKVLEENKFQMGGLVEDSQISEIGKKMGADYVCVAIITSLGKNFYISCKLISVLTARIEKQSTGKTSKGSGDLDTATRRIANEMFPNNSIIQRNKRKINDFLNGKKKEQPVNSSK